MLKINKLQDEVSKCFCGEPAGHAIKMIMLGLITQQNVLLVGPPGTGKSDIVNCVTQAISAKLFSIQMSKFTTPEDLFGVVSFKAMEEGSYRRITSNRLPEADLAFLDELFRGSASILESVLKMFESKLFDNDGKEVKIPLMSVIAATNNIPVEQDYKALLDRFSIKSYIPYTETFSDIVRTPRWINKKKSIVSLSDLVELRDRLSNIVLSDAILLKISKIQTNLKKEGIEISPRRCWHIFDLMKASALLDERDAVEDDDIGVISDSVWATVAQIEVVNKIVRKISNSLGMKLIELFDAANVEFTKAVEKNFELNDCINANSAIKSALKAIRKIVEDKKTSLKISEQATTYINELTNKNKQLMTAMGISL